MAYTKNVWEIFNPDIPEEEQENSFITKAKLDNIEDGIAAAHELAENAGADLAIGEVVAGDEASAEIVEGKLNLVLPKGDQGPAGVAGPVGDKGDTPVKGVDYFNEEDIEAFKNDLLDSRQTKPYFHEELNAVYACGVHIFVNEAEEAGKLKISWRDDLVTGSLDSIIVPEGITIFGGGLGDTRPVYYPATRITVNGGVLKSVVGGNNGHGIVGNAHVVINGGTISGLGAGGMHLGVKRACVNHVGHAELIVNGGDLYVSYGGSPSGHCSVSTAKCIINGGKLEWLTGGNANGDVSVVDATINGGNISVVQGCNRGTAGSIKISVNGGEIGKL